MKSPKKLPLNPKKAIQELAAADETMGRAIEACGKFALPKREVDFFMFCSSIIGQSISTKAAKSIVQRFEDRYGSRHVINPRKIAKEDPEEIRTVGLNATKAGAIKAVAALWVERKWDASVLEAMPDEAFIEAITTVRGIGPWTAKMILIFGLRRPDVFAEEDLGVREGIKQIYKLEERPSAKESLQMSEAWAPWRTVATVTCWQFLMRQQQGSLNDGNGWW